MKLGVLTITVCLHVYTYKFMLMNEETIKINYITGLKDSVWEDGKFHVTLKFSEHYNEEPPDITFNTIPFHPNSKLNFVSYVLFCL